MSTFPIRHDYAVLRFANDDSVANSFKALESFGLMRQCEFWGKNSMMMCRNEYVARIVGENKDAVMRRIASLASAQPNGDAIVVFHGKNAREMNARYYEIQLALNDSFEVWMDAQKNAIYCSNPVLAAKIGEDKDLHGLIQTNHLQQIASVDGHTKEVVKLDDKSQFASAFDALNEFGLAWHTYFWCDDDCVVKCRNEYVARMVNDHKGAFMRRVRELASDQPNGNATVIYRANDADEMRARYDVIRYAINDYLEVWMDWQENTIYCSNPILATKIAQDVDVKRYRQTMHLWDSVGRNPAHLCSANSLEEVQKIYDELQRACNGTEAIAIEKSAWRAGEWALMCNIPILQCALRERGLVE